MSIESPKPNLRTREEVLQYLKSKNLLKGEVADVDKKIDALLKTAQEFKPENPTMALKLYYEIGRIGFLINRNQQDRLFKELTGCEVKDLIEMGARTSEIIVAEPVEIENGGQTGTRRGEVTENTEIAPVDMDKEKKSILDRVADAKITNLTVDMVKFGMKTYPKIKGNCTLLNILKGTGLGAVGLTTILAGSGVILAARTLRLAGKVLKAARGTAANALHKNALKNMKKTKKGIEAEQQQLAELSKTQRGELDAFVLENGVDGDKAYKTIQSLREEKILPQDAERTILSEYDDISLSRDENITRIINADTLEMIEQTYGINQDEMAKIISRTTVDEDGNIEFPEDVNLPEFDEDILNAIRVAVADEGIVMGAQESSKLAVSEYIEYKDGKIEVKEGVDLRELPKEVGRIVARMQGARVPEDLFNQVMINNKSITALIMCEEEILTNTAIEANREMSELYDDRGEIVTDEKKGVVRSSIEAITAASLHARAKTMVEKRVEAHITEAITKNGGASERLIALAREKLIENTQDLQQTRGEQVIEAGDTQPAAEHDEK